MSKWPDYGLMTKICRQNMLLCLTETNNFIIVFQMIYSLHHDYKKKNKMHNCLKTKNCAINMETNAFVTRLILGME
jgi:hypothetical protein